VVTIISRLELRPKTLRDDFSPLLRLVHGIAPWRIPGNIGVFPAILGASMLFSEILASIKPFESGWTAEVSSDWSQGRATFGGLVAALGNEAMRFLVAADRPLRSLDVTFVGPVLAGSVRVDAEVLRIGKAVTIASARLLSDGQPAATLTGIYGQARAASLNVAPAQPPVVRPVEELPDAVASPEFKTPTFLQHFGVRWAEGSRPFSGSHSRSSKIYIRHRDPAPFTESHAVALIDCIPPPILQMMTAPAANSSVTWTLEFLRHDYNFSPEAWWRIDTDVKASADGYCQESSVVMDPNGAPMAFSRQLVAVFG
jgi:acyl-CoA thioesterase